MTSRVQHPQNILATEYSKWVLNTNDSIHHATSKVKHTDHQLTNHQLTDCQCTNCQSTVMHTVMWPIAIQSTVTWLIARWLTVTWLTAFTNMIKYIHQCNLQSKTSFSVLITTVQWISTAMWVTVFTHTTSRVQRSPAYWPSEYIEWVLQCNWQHVTNIIFSYVWHALARSESFSDAKLEQLR